MVRSFITSRTSCSLPLASLFREIIFGNNDGPDFPIQKTLDAVLPGLIEVDTVDVLQQIYPHGRLADLKNRAVPKIGGAQAGERCTVLSERAKYCLAVFFVGA